MIYAGLVPAERTALHQAIAAALREAGAPAARLADQWHRAGAPADALAASPEAGAQASDAFAFAEAGAHYERALAYDITGRVARTRASGTFRVGLTETDAAGNVTAACDSGSVSWSAVTG